MEKNLKDHQDLNVNTSSDDQDVNDDSIKSSDSEASNVSPSEIKNTQNASAVGYNAFDSIAELHHTKKQSHIRGSDNPSYNSTDSEQITQHSENLETESDIEGSEIQTQNVTDSEQITQNSENLETESDVEGSEIQTHNVTDSEQITQHPENSETERNIKSDPVALLMLANAAIESAEPELGSNQVDGVVHQTFVSVGDNTGSSNNRDSNKDADNNNTTNDNDTSSTESTTGGETVNEEETASEGVWTALSPAVALSSNKTQNNDGDQSEASEDSPFGVLEFKKQ